jgi:hypothetical protein
LIVFQIGNELSHCLAFVGTGSHFTHFARLTEECEMLLVLFSSSPLWSSNLPARQICHPPLAAPILGWLTGLTDSSRQLQSRTHRSLGLAHVEGADGARPWRPMSTHMCRSVPHGRSGLHDKSDDAWMAPHLSHFIQISVGAYILLATYLAWLEPSRHMVHDVFMSSTNGTHTVKEVTNP